MEMRVGRQQTMGLITVLDQVVVRVRLAVLEAKRQHLNLE
jgi:hypothetical protein